MSLIQEPVDCQTYPMKRATHFCVGWYGDGGLNGLANDGRHGELEGVHRGEAGGEAQGDMVDGDRIYGPTACHTTRNVLWAPSIGVLSLRWALRGFSSAWTIAPFSSIGPPSRYTHPLRVGVLRLLTASTIGIPCTQSSVGLVRSVRKPCVHPPALVPPVELWSAPNFMRLTHSWAHDQ